MSNRKHFFSFGSSKTEMKIVKCGVSQGSILRPLFLLIFINYLNNSTKVFDPVLFADDTNLFCSDDDIRNLFETTNQERNQINDWFLANELKKKQNICFSHKPTDQDE